MRGQHLLNHRAHLRQRQVRLPAPPALVLQEAVRDARSSTTWRCQPGQAASFEVVEPDLVFEFLILLLDRPALMREAAPARAAGRSAGRSTR